MSSRRGAAHIGLVVGVATVATFQVLTTDSPLGWVLSGVILLGILARMEHNAAQLRREFRGDVLEIRRSLDTLAQGIATLRERIGDESVREQISYWMSKVASQTGATIGDLDLRLTERAEYVDQRLAELERQLRGRKG